MNNTHVLTEELGEIKGYVNRIYGISMIHLNKNLSSTESAEYIAKGAEMLNIQSNDFALQFIELEKKKPQTAICDL